MSAAFGYTLQPVAHAHLAVLHVAESPFLVGAKNIDRATHATMGEALIAARIISLPPSENLEEMVPNGVTLRDRWNIIRSAFSNRYFLKQVEALRQHLAPTLKQVITFEERK
jgi:hypothetical protein